METLDQVLARLDQIIASAKAENAAFGYFAALYRAMTVEVKMGSAGSQFDDPARMERLDVAFAKRYFSAFDLWRAGGVPPKSWLAAFEASENSKVIVLQHLMLGVHAHINFDLGAAAAEIAPGAAIFEMENDFNRINQIIGQLTDRVQEGLTQIWPPLAVFDAVLKTRDEGFINFSTKVARDTAWQAATALAFLDGEERQVFLENLDSSVAFFAGKILRPGLLIGAVLPTIRRLEIGRVGEKIEKMEAVV